MQICEKNMVWATLWNFAYFALNLSKYLFLEPQRKLVRDLAGQLDLLC